MTMMAFNALANVLGPTGKFSILKIARYKNMEVEVPHMHRGTSHIQDATNFLNILTDSGSSV